MREERTLVLRIHRWELPDLLRLDDSVDIVQITLDPGGALDVLMQSKNFPLISKNGAPGKTRYANIDTMTGICSTVYASESVQVLKPTYNYKGSLQKDLSDLLSLLNDDKYEEAKAATERMFEFWPSRME